SLPIHLIPCASTSFFFTAPATPEISPLSLHDALPILDTPGADVQRAIPEPGREPRVPERPVLQHSRLELQAQELTQLEPGMLERSEEHTSELQSLTNLVCRLLLEKKKNTVDDTLRHIP